MNELGYGLRCSSTYIEVEIVVDKIELIMKTNKPYLWYNIYTG